MPVTIAELHQAPLKSGQAYEDVTKLEIDHTGLIVGDRKYMWVEGGVHVNTEWHKGEVARPGQFISQREDPVALARMKPVLTMGGILLCPLDSDSLWVPAAEDTAENRIPVSVHRWNGEAVDQGEDAAFWGTRHIGRPARLVAVSNEEPRYVEGDPALGRVGFADAYAFTVGSTTTINLVNAHLESRGRPPMSNRRARATIILDGLSVEDPRAFPEDFVETIRIASGGLELVLARRKACARCPIPDTDPTTGERKQYIRSALGKLGRTGTHLDKVRYGDEEWVFMFQNFVVEALEGMEEGQVFTLKPDDAEVEVTYSNETNWIPRQPKAA